MRQSPAVQMCLAIPIKLCTSDTVCCRHHQVAAAAVSPAVAAGSNGVAAVVKSANGVDGTHVGAGGRNVVGTGASGGVATGQKKRVRSPHTHVRLNSREPVTYVKDGKCKACDGMHRPHTCGKVGQVLALRRCKPASDFVHDSASLFLQIDREGG